MQIWAFLTDIQQACCIEAYSWFCRLGDLNFGDKLIIACLRGLMFHLRILIMHYLLTALKQIPEIWSWILGLHSRMHSRKSVFPLWLSSGIIQDMKTSDSIKGKLDAIGHEASWVWNKGLLLMWRNGSHFLPILSCYHLTFRMPLRLLSVIMTSAEVHLSPRACNSPFSSFCTFWRKPCTKLMCADNWLIKAICCNHSASADLMPMGPDKRPIWDQGSVS